MDSKKQAADSDGKRPGLQLVNTSMLLELNITLSDFLPKEGGHLMRLSSGTMVIGPRLRDALRGYAARRDMSLLQALERLRDEVQAQRD